MRIRIDADSDIAAARARELLRYSLSGISDKVSEACVSVTPVRDRLGTRLIRCRVRFALRNAERIDVQETQSGTEFAVSRALERACRAAHRRLNGVARQSAGSL